ncbi:MAG: MATE family efflux transporter, partial [Huintestinicola sp.]
MNVEKVSGKKILGDTVKMTVLSLAMQTAAMFFNVYLSEKAGTAAVGFMSLIFSLFSFIMVLANGNILTSTSRFVSEARGAGRCGFGRLMRYALTFSFCLSMFFSVSSFVLAGSICRIFLKNEALAPAVRFIALSLPFASAGSCIKGYFHGIRRVSIPMHGDLVEFASKWTLLLGGLLIWGHLSGGIDGSSTFYIMTAAAVFAGEAVSFFYYLLRFIPEAMAFASLPPCGMSLITDTPKGYLKSTFPILVSGYVQMLLSTANELIVPAALLKYSRSTEAALASYGMFEAMIMPAVFFPSAVLTSLSGVIVPEAALANQLPDRSVRRKRLRTLTDDTFTKVCSFAFFISGLFL